MKGLIYNPEDPLSYNQLGKYDNNRTHDSTMFLGIPYAAPPVGDNRFKGPKNAKNWDGIMETFSNQAACAQNCPDPCPTAISEDCLYLNVYVPTKALQQEEQLPVLVYYHGGSFAWGSGGSFLYDGRYIAPDMNIIVVTVNYRLTAFGFLKLGIKEEGEITNSNWGFMDQQKALTWVYENIENFSGDKSRITIAGQSAGGVSVSLHQINKQSSSMINNVIVQSNPLAIGLKENWEGDLQSAYFSRYSGCQPYDVKCLRNLKMDQILKYVKDTPNIVNPEHVLHAATPFAPIIDNVLFHEQPMDTLRNGDYDDSINTIIGAVQHESEMFVRSIFESPIGGNAYKLVWKALMRVSTYISLYNCHITFNRMNRHQLP